MKLNEIVSKPHLSFVLTGQATAAKGERNRERLLDVALRDLAA